MFFINSFFDVISLNFIFVDKKRTPVPNALEWRMEPEIMV